MIALLLTGCFGTWEVSDRGPLLVTAFTANRSTATVPLTLSIVGDNAYYTGDYSDLFTLEIESDDFDLGEDNVWDTGVDDTGVADTGPLPDASGQLHIWFIPRSTSLIPLGGWGPELGEESYSSQGALSGCSGFPTCEVELQIGFSLDAPLSDETLVLKWRPSVSVAGKLSRGNPEISSLEIDAGSDEE